MRQMFKFNYMRRKLCVRYELRTAHCTMHTAQCTLHTAHCTMHTAYCTMHTAYCTMHTAHCTLHTPTDVITYTNNDIGDSGTSRIRKHEG
jgi:hypothetical protein